METAQEHDAELLALNARVERAEHRARHLQEAAEKQAMLLEYLEPRNEALSRLVAELTIENTRLRIARTVAA